MTPCRRRGGDAAGQHDRRVQLSISPGSAIRVPTVLISPLIAPGTVYRVPDGSTPLDHTSTLKTVEQRWGLPALTARTPRRPGFGDVLTLTTPTDR